MTLIEMSPEYRRSASLLVLRIGELKMALRCAPHGGSARRELRRRLAVLTRMLEEVAEIAELTEKYYERGFYKHGPYTY